MRAWLLRAFWLALYPIIHVPLLIPLVALLGTWSATLVGILVIGVWSSVFYFLLRRNPDSTKGRGKPLQPHWVNQALAWVRSRSSKPLWVATAFVFLGAWGGVILLRMTYPDERPLRALLWVWLGSFVNATVLVVVVYGPPALLARELVMALFGG